MNLEEALYIVIVSAIAVGMGIIAGQLTEWLLPRNRKKQDPD